MLTGLIIVGALVMLFVAGSMLGVTDPLIPGPIDTQELLQASVTKTSSFNSTAIDRGSGFAPSGGGLPVQGIVPVTALDTANTDETYTLKLQESDDNSSFTDITPAVSVTATGTYLCKGFLRKRYVRLVATLGGTTPSLTYGAAYLAPQTV